MSAAIHCIVVLGEVDPELEELGLQGCGLLISQFEVDGALCGLLQQFLLLTKPLDRSIGGAEDS